MSVLIKEIVKYDCIKFKNIRLRRWFSSDPCKEQVTGRKGLVLGATLCDSGEMKLSKAAEKVNTRLCGKLLDMANAAGPLKLGKCHVFNNIDKEYWGICLAGLGKECASYDEVENLDLDKEQARWASAAGATRLRKEGVTHIYVEDMNGHAESAAEGACLACWRFQENMLKSNWRVVPMLDLYESPQKEEWTKGILKAEAQNLARKLCDMPANQLTPVTFAQATVDALCPCGITVEVRDKDWIEDQCMNTFLTVAKGSCEPPIFLELIYCGGCPDDKPLVMVGAGITFDSGGMHLKDCHDLYPYRGAMAGAAVVVAAMRAAAAMQLPINLTGLIPLCEHMPSGLAMKPGDVVQALNGKWIVIQDCDKECRVMLADVLHYAQKGHKPGMLLDITCLTDGVKHVLGQGGCGVFTTNKKHWHKFRKAGAYTGDRCWRLPLWYHYNKEIHWQNAVDLTNHTRFHGDACVGAAFLREFISSKLENNWIHMDITGVAFPIKTPSWPYLRIDRMTGRPTRTVIEFIKTVACEKKK